MRSPQMFLLRLFFLLGTVVLTQVVSAFSQQTPNDAQVAMVQAVAAFSRAQVNSVHMSGSARAIAGSSDQTGTFTLDLQSDGTSKLGLDTGTLSRTETTGPFSKAPACSWSGADAVEHTTANHNCWLPVHWMIPILALQNPAIALVPSVNIGTDNDGSSVQVLTLRRTVQSRVAGKWIARFSKVAISLDAVSLAPRSLSFSQHPDHDSFTDIQVAVRYSDYHQVSGVTLPFRIQKYLNNGLVLDLQVRSATVQ